GVALCEVAGASGRLERLGGTKQGILELNVEGAPSNEEAWQGFSGAPVFADGYLVGIVHQAIFSGRRLYATPLESLTNLSAVRAVLGRHTLHQVPSSHLQLYYRDEVPADARPATLLHPRHQVVRFDRVIREQELRVIDQWLSSERQQNIQLVVGPGGAGK